jgi:hypothetical protein
MEHVGKDVTASVAQSCRRRDASRPDTGVLALGRADRGEAYWARDRP